MKFDKFDLEQTILSSYFQCLAAVSQQKRRLDTKQSLLIQGPELQARVLADFTVFTPVQRSCAIFQTILVTGLEMEQGPGITVRRQETAFKFYVAYVCLCNQISRLLYNM